MSGRPHLQHVPFHSRLALVAGGGSGGHVFPGLAVARELQERGWRVDWVGRPPLPAEDVSHDDVPSLEAKIVAREDAVRFHGLPARPLVGKGFVARLEALAVLAASTLRARALVRRLGARVVLGTGGYASVPAVLGARLAGVPALLLEPNAEAGAANRLLSRWAAEAVVAHDATAAGLRCDAVTTGVPVRSEFFDVAPNLPFGEPLRLLVLGGSQGARSVNEALPGAVAALHGFEGDSSRGGRSRGGSVSPLFVRHQAGARHADATRALWRDRGVEVLPPSPRGYSAGWQSGGPELQVAVTPFLDDVAAAMAESHLIVSRAGAITLAEICAAGRPSLLLPLALAGGHQESNALRLKQAGAAEVLALGGDPASFQAALSTALGSLLSRRERLDAMASAARRLGRRDAAAAIADRVEAHALPVRRNGTRESGHHVATPTGGTA